MDTLKPCPFCGGVDLRIEIIPTLDERRTIHYVVCNHIDCNAEGPVCMGKSGAIEKWNAAPRQEAKE